MVQAVIKNRFLAFSQHIQNILIKKFTMYYIRTKYFASRYYQQNDGDDDDDDDKSRNTLM